MDPKLEEAFLADKFEYDGVVDLTPEEWEYANELTRRRGERISREIEENCTPEELERRREIPKIFRRMWLRRLGGEIKVADLIRSDDEEAGPGSAAFDQFERHLWLDIWHSVSLWSIEDFELLVEVRRYGSVQVTVADEPDPGLSADEWTTEDEWVELVELLELGVPKGRLSEDAPYECDRGIGDYRLKPSLGETPMFNNVVGADFRGAVKGGHLGAALDWVGKLGVDCRVPVSPSRTEGAAAEELLKQRGYERAEDRVRYVRPPTPPDATDPSGIKVIELFPATMEEKFLRAVELRPEERDKIQEMKARVLRPADPTPDERQLHTFIRELSTVEEDKFCELLASGYGLSEKAEIFFGALPGRRAWRCYLAIDEAGSYIGAAAMMFQSEFAQLVFAAVTPESRRKGCHAALLNRQIRDAADAGRSVLFAETSEAPLDLGGDSAGRRSLLSAGFEQLHVRTTWRPPHR